MTFGEHLEELRKCLFKSVVGLAIAFVVGLYFGDYVVQFIQRPLSRALSAYYQQETMARVKAETDKLSNDGEGRTLPWTQEQVKHRVEQEGLLAEEGYIDVAQVLPELKRILPKQFGDVELPSQGKADAPTDASPDAPPDAPPDGKATTETNAAGLIRVYFWRPSKAHPRMQIKSLATQEPFTVYVKASLLLGVLLASPWIFIQIWTFVAAGLYPHERHYVHMYLPFSIGLFLGGAALAFFWVFDPVLNFLLGFNRTTGIAPEPRINEWLSFVLMLPIGFGIGFQLPLVMLFLERIGLFSVAGYLKQWKIAVLVIFVIAALLTPPDPYSMMLMACPLTFLYFGGVLLCKLMPRHKASRDLTTTG